jgi:hypothetical protein
MAGYFAEYLTGLTGIFDGELMESKMIDRLEKPFGTALARLALCGGLALLGAGGAGMSAAADTPPELQVLTRAQARWDAAVAGDFEKSYSFTAPSYRALTPFKNFKAQRTGEASLASAKVIGVECGAESCAAKVRIEFYGPITKYNTAPSLISTHYDERWVVEEGNWWLFLQ